MAKDQKLVQGFRFGRIEEGAHRGLPTFFLELSGKGGEMNELAEVLYNLQHFSGCWCKTLLLEGFFTPENDDPILLLIASLKNFGWQILVKTGTEGYRSWFTTPVRVGGTLLPGVDWIIMTMFGLESWTPFWCHELHYYMKERDEEPILPHDPNNLIRYYISGENPERVWSFIEGGERKWRWLT